MMTNQILGFITQPISTIYNLYHFDEVRKAHATSSSAVSTIGAYFAKGLPPAAGAKIKTFISEALNFDLKNIAMQINPQLLGPAAMRGSLQHGRGLLEFSPEFIQEVEAGFNTSHQFTIAHELAHLINDDFFAGEVKKEYVSQWVSLGAYVFTAAASLFASTDFIRMHLLACVVAKCAKFYMSQKIQMQHELRADLHAAQRSPEIASGGIDTIHQLQQHNLQVKERWLTHSSGLIYFFKKVVLDIFISPRGDIRFFGGHPPGQTRIDQISPYQEPTRPVVKNDALHDLLPTS